MSLPLKFCPRCDQEKPHADFHKQSRSRDGLAWCCAACANEHKRFAYAASPGKPRKLTPEATSAKREYDQKYHRLRKYGITPEQFDARLTAQGGVCASCGEVGDQKWHVDHNHDCCPGSHTCGNCIRGILCNLCNKGLGHFKDDPKRLRAAADYLERTT